MKKDYFWSMLAIIMAAVLSVGFTSCGGDDDDDLIPEPTTVSNTIRVTNSTGNYTFKNFTFIFCNRDGETVSTKECGTVGDNDSATASIPTGCTYFYFGFHIGNYTVISPNYYIDDTSTRNIRVSYEMVTSWDVYE